MRPERLSINPLDLGQGFGPNFFFLNNKKKIGPLLKKMLKTPSKKIESMLLNALVQRFSVSSMLSFYIFYMIRFLAILYLKISVNVSDY